MLVYRVDRLGRSLRALLDAHDALERLGVPLRSGTEPIDTSTPIGRFIFQLLGSFAELERATIQDRLTGSRDRVARSGKYTDGYTPMGYDVRADGQIMPSARLLPDLDMTEADLIRDVFARIAAGSTLQAEARRLDALGITPVKRYGNGAVKECGDWSVSRLWGMIRNPVYKGEGVLRSRNGDIARPIPALLDPATGKAAQAALTQNRRLSRKNAKRVYLLRGLITCENCGLGFSGRATKATGGREWRHYQCNGGLSAMRLDPANRCRSRFIEADYLEQLIWDDIKHWADNPGDYLADAQRQMRERMAQSTDAEAQRRKLLHAIAEKETERDRVLTMYRRGRIMLDHADRELEAIAEEVSTLRRLVESLHAQEALTAAAEAHLTNTAMALAQLRERVEEIERTGDLPAKREVIELLVSRILIHTEPAAPRKHKRATVTITYAYQEPRAVAVDSATASARRS